MRATSLVILLAILAFNTACCSKTQSFEFGCVDECVPDTIIIEKTKYLEKTIPPLPSEPVPSEYKTYVLEVNGQQFYAYTRQDSAKMAGNWESYKGYTKSLREIIISLENNETSEKGR